MSESVGKAWANGEHLPHALGTDRATSRHRKGQTLFSKGDLADAVFYIKEGMIKRVAISAQGKEAVIAMQAPGAFVGEECLAGQTRRNSSAIAMTDCEVLRVEKAAMVRALHDDVDFAGLFTMHLLNRTKRLEDDLTDQLFHSSEQRLARALLLLADLGEDGRTETIIESVSQLTLAKMIGTTRSRVNFFMNKFRKLGFIEYNGYLKVNVSLMNVITQEYPRRKTDGGRSPTSS